MIYRNTVNFSSLILEPGNLSITSLGICKMYCKSIYDRYTCTSMVTDALFTIAKKWTSPRCTSADEKNHGAHKQCNFFSSLRKNEIKIFSLKWIELVSIMLSEISQAQKDKYCIFLILCGSEI